MIVIISKYFFIYSLCLSLIKKNYLKLSLIFLKSNSYFVLNRSLTIFNSYTYLLIYKQICENIIYIILRLANTTMNNPYIF